MRNKNEHIQVVQCSEHAIATLHQPPQIDGLVVTILPRHHATVRVVELPSQDPAEIAQMATLSAEEMVPFSKDEIVLSSTILTKLPGGASQVLIAIAHLDVIEQHIQRLRDLGIEAQALYLSTACLLAALVKLPTKSDTPTA